MPQDAVDGRAGRLRHFPAGKAMAFHDPHLGAAGFRRRGPCESGPGEGLRWARRSMPWAMRKSATDSTRSTNRHPPRRRRRSAGTGRQGGPRSHASRFPRARIPPLRATRQALRRRQAQVVGPIDQSRPRFFEQSACNPPSVGTLLAELGEEPLYQRGRPRLRFPREIVHDLAHASAVNCSLPR